ncbi:uncharacterized protein TNCV_4164991 [Trichonephila clavipes]|nr:uncharacterized protein TNCV_4164991 [Trichonephila clavipes]
MAKSRSGRSKKRRFTGNRYTIRATINENDETSELNSTESASAKKLESSHTTGKKLCAFLGLPFLSKLAFRNQERKLLKATERVAQENINAALSEIKGSNSFTKCGISIDGTWQRRGYSSLNGCVNAISDDTGKILDIEVMTQYCHICVKGNSQSSKHNYYGIAIRSNVGNLQKMMSSVIAAFFHCVSGKNNSLHGQCPEGSESWVSLPKGKSSWESPQRN